MNRSWWGMVGGLWLASGIGCGSGGGNRGLIDVDLREEEHRHHCSRFSTPSDDEVAPPLVQGTVFALVLDDDGNRYLAGQFCGMRDFDPGPGVDDHDGGRSADVFVTRFNADSSYAWTTTFSGSGNDGATALAVIGHTLYVSGDFASTDFRAGSTTIATLGDFDTFIVSLDTGNGHLREDFGRGGVARFGGTDADFCEALSVTDDALFVCGSFASRDAGIDGPGSARSVGRLDGFVAAIDRLSGDPLPAFGHAGVQTFGGSRSDQAFDVLVSATTVYVAGTFWSGDFGIGANASIASERLFDAFIVALVRTSGQPDLAFGTGGVQTFGGSDEDVAEALALSGKTLYVGGRFGSDNAGVGGPSSFAPANDAHDAFVLALDAKDGSLHTTFGAGGLEVFGGFGVPRRGFDFEGVTSMIVAGEVLYAGGFLRSKDAGVGAPGPIDSRGFADAFAWAMNAANGNPELDFGTGGVQTFGGSGNDLLVSLAIHDGNLVLGGRTDSVDAFVADCGPFNSRNWGGFVLAVDAVSGAPECADAYPD